MELRGALGNHSTFHMRDVAGLQPLALGEEVLEIVAANSRSCVLLKSRNVQCWGRNSEGQLGLGHTTVIGDNEFPTKRNSLTFKETGDPVTAYFDSSPGSTNPMAFHFDAGKSSAQGTITSYAWNFGDQETGTGSSTSHTFTQPGFYTVSLTVTDQFNQTHQVSQSILVERENSSPILPRGQSFTVAGGLKTTLSLAKAFDFDSTAFTYHLVESPGQGSLSNCLGGMDDLVCTYTSPANFTGEVLFGYKANDSVSDSSAVTVTLNIVDSAPAVLAISGLRNHACTLFDNKKVKCWGRNSYGQLGYGNRHYIGDDELASAQNFVDVGDNVVQIAVGGSHTCALLEDRNVKCWGRNNNGQLGLGHTQSIGDNEAASSVTSLSLGEKVRQIVAGGTFSCALTEMGRVKCWGANSNGQLGLGHTQQVGHSELAAVGQSPFINIGGKVSKLAAGWEHVCALLENQKLKCWGQNNNGQLGLGNTSNIGDNEHPVSAGDVSVGQDVRDVSLGRWNTCALLADQTVKCWGHYSLLGQQSYYDSSNSIGNNELPSTIASLTLGGEVKQVTISWQHACALLRNGKVKCWGEGGLGTLGNHSTLPIRDVAQLQPLPLDEQVLQIASASHRSYVLLKSKSVRGWGQNNFGQLGLGHTLHVGDDEYPGRANSTIFKQTGHPVLAHFDFSASSTNPLTLDFDATGSFTTGTIASYAWDFGDESTGTGVSTSHTFANSGFYTVSLTVTDHFNQTHQVSRTLFVEADSSTDMDDGEGSGGDGQINHFLQTKIKDAGNAG